MPTYVLDNKGNETNLTEFRQAFLWLQDNFSELPGRLAKLIIEYPGDVIRDNIIGFFFAEYQPYDLPVRIGRRVDIDKDDKLLVLIDKNYQSLPSDLHMFVINITGKSIYAENTEQQWALLSADGEVLDASAELWSAALGVKGISSGELIQEGLSSRTMLIVDDAPEIRSIISDSFADQDFHIVSLASAEEALKYVEENKVLICFLDMKLPGMDGIEFQKAIMQLNPLTFTFALTGFASVYDLSYCRKAGFDDYFSKPFKIEDIRESVADALKKIKRWRTLAK